MYVEIANKPRYLYSRVRERRVAADISREATYTYVCTYNVFGYTDLNSGKKIKYVLREGNPRLLFQAYTTQHRMFHYLLKQTIIAALPPTEYLTL